MKLSEYVKKFTPTQDLLYCQCLDKVYNSDASKRLLYAMKSQLGTEIVDFLYSSQHRYQVSYPCCDINWAESDLNWDMIFNGIEKENPISRFILRLLKLKQPNLMDRDDRDSVAIVIYCVALMSN